MVRRSPQKPDRASRAEDGSPAPPLVGYERLLSVAALEDGPDWIARAHLASTRSTPPALEPEVSFLEETLDLPFPGAAQEDRTPAGRSHFHLELDVRPVVHRHPVGLFLAGRTPPPPYPSPGLDPTADAHRPCEEDG